jgi:hypothetical protein
VRTRSQRRLSLPSKLPLLSSPLRRLRVLTPTAVRRRSQRRLPLPRLLLLSQ